MTEGSAVSAFDLTSARPDTAHQQVGGSPACQEPETVACRLNIIYNCQVSEKRAASVPTMRRGFQSHNAPAGWRPRALASLRSIRSMTTSRQIISS